MNLRMKTNLIIQIERHSGKPLFWTFQKSQCQKKTISKKAEVVVSQLKEARDLITKINKWSLLNHEFIFYKQV